MHARRFCLDQGDGGEVAAAVNAACLALADAGVPLFGLVAACAAAAPRADAALGAAALGAGGMAGPMALVMDPSRAEEGAAGLTMAVLYTGVPSPNESTLLGDMGDGMGDGVSRKSVDGGGAGLGLNLQAGWREGVCNLEQHGRVDLNEFLALMDLARRGCAEIRAELADTLAAAACRPLAARGDYVSE
jgi:ribonuclease PH